MFRELIMFCGSGETILEEVRPPSFEKLTTPSITIPTICVGSLTVIMAAPESPEPPKTAPFFPSIFQSNASSTFCIWWSPRPPVQTGPPKSESLTYIQNVCIIKRWNSNGMNRNDTEISTNTVLTLPMY